jgi:hypothetical protein
MSKSPPEDAAATDEDDQNRSLSFAPSFASLYLVTSGVHQRRREARAELPLAQDLPNPLPAGGVECHGTARSARAYGLSEKGG